MGTGQQWQELYRAAVLETNWSRMTERVSRSVILDQLVFWEGQETRSGALCKAPATVVPCHLISCRSLGNPF